MHSHAASDIGEGSRLVLPGVRLPTGESRASISICNGVITAVRSDTPESFEGALLSHAEGSWCLPGLVDIHCHLTGGGGSGGPATRPHPVSVDDLLRAGVTTVAGCIGRDASPGIGWQMLRQVRGLRQAGVNAKMFTGGLGPLPATILGSAATDVALVDDVVGVKLSVDDDSPERSSSKQTQELKEVVAMAREFGRKLRIQVHVGPAGRHMAECLRLLERLSRLGDVDVAVTHMNWSKDHLDAASDVTDMRFKVDVTSVIRPELVADGIGVPDALDRLQSRGVAPDAISASSDANGAHLEGSGSSRTMVVHRLELHWEAFKDVWTRQGIGRAVQSFCQSPATFLGMDGRGTVQAGQPADLLLVDDDQQVHHAITAAGVVWRNDG